MTVVRLEVREPIHLRAFNRLDWRMAVELIRPCLDVPRWWEVLLLTRPYHDYESLLENARDAAYPLTGAELHAAVDQHLSQRRPADARSRDVDLLPGYEPDVDPRWAGLTEQYERRFGRPFIIRAAGRSTAEIRASLSTRLSNDEKTEDRVVANQLRQITLLALTRRVVE